MQRVQALRERCSDLQSDNERLRLQVIDACSSVANDIACFHFPSLHHASADFCVQAPIRHGSSASNVQHCTIVTKAAF